MTSKNSGLMVEREREREIQLCQRGEKYCWWTFVKLTNIWKYWKILLMNSCQIDRYLEIFGNIVDELLSNWQIFGNIWKHWQILLMNFCQIEKIFGNISLWRDFLLRTQEIWSKCSNVVPFSTFCLYCKVYVVVWRMYLIL